MYDDEYCSVSELIGKTFSDVKMDSGDRRINFFDGDDIVYALYHQQDCCESVYIEDICGDLSDLIGVPILSAENSSSEPPREGAYGYIGDDVLWTFFKIHTSRGYVTIRFLGSSNGYYGVSASLYKIGSHS